MDNAVIHKSQRIKALITNSKHHFLYTILYNK